MKFRIILIFVDFIDFFEKNLKLNILTQNINTLTQFNI